MIIKSGHHHLPLAHRLWAEEGACHRWLHPWPDTRFTQIMNMFQKSFSQGVWNCGASFYTHPLSLRWFLIILPSKDHTLISHFGSTTDPKSESSIIPLPPVWKAHQILLTKIWPNIFDQMFWSHPCPVLPAMGGGTGAARDVWSGQGLPRRCAWVYLAVPGSTWEGISRHTDKEPPPQGETIWPQQGRESHVELVMRLLWLFWR